MRLDGRNASPAQLMFGRQTRTLLPAAPQLLTALAQSPHEAQQALRQSKIRQALFSDRGDRALSLSLSPLTVGDVVRVREERGSWTRGSIRGYAETPRSYRVALESGTELRRNHRHLRKSAEQFRPQPVPESAPSSEPDSLVPRMQPEPTPPPVDAGRAPDRPTTTRSGRTVRTPSYLRDYL